MAALLISKYNNSNRPEVGNLANCRMIDFVVDLSKDVTMTTATDTAAVASLPAGTWVLAGGIEQVVAGSAGNTLVAQIGSVTLSGTLASDAVAGTYTANADVSGGTPVLLTAQTDLRVLSATAARVTGIIRVFALVIEASAVTIPGIAQRDASL